MEELNSHGIMEISIKVTEFKIKELKNVNIILIW